MEEFPLGRLEIDPVNIETTSNFDKECYTQNDDGFMGKTWSRIDDLPVRGFVIKRVEWFYGDKIVASRCIYVIKSLQKIIIDIYIYTHGG